MFKKLYYLVPVTAAICLAVNASAGTIIYHWTGGGDNTSWSDGDNWDNGVPDPLNTYQIYIGFSGDVGTTINMTGSDDGAYVSDSLFGPEWGETLNLNNSSIYTGFAVFPMGSSGTGASTVNLYGNSSITCGDTFSIGTAWWFPGGPYVTVNVDGNSTASANWWQVGGVLNINDNGTVTANDGFNLGVDASTPIFAGGVDTDATRLVDISGNGKLIIAGNVAATVYNWIDRGIIEGNGIVGNIQADTTSDPGWTIVTVPEPASVALLGLGGCAMMLAFRRRR